MNLIAITEAIERIEEVIEESSQEDIVKSAEAALETLLILDGLGFNNISMEDIDE